MRPVLIHRSTREWFNAMDRRGNWPLAIGNIVHHTYHLVLPAPLTLRG